MQNQKKSSTNSGGIIGNNISRAVPKVTKGSSTTKQNKARSGIVLDYGAAGRKITSDN